MSDLLEAATNLIKQSEDIPVPARLTDSLIAIKIAVNKEIYEETDTVQVSSDFVNAVQALVDELGYVKNSIYGNAVYDKWNSLKDLLPPKPLTVDDFEAGRLYEIEWKSGGESIAFISISNGCKYVTLSNWAEGDRLSNRIRRFKSAKRIDVESAE